MLKRFTFFFEQNKIPAGSPNVIDVESKVILNKEVSKITYDATSTAADRIKVDCSDGSSYDCEHLICTISLGVLKKRHLQLFEPLLPRSKITCIDAIGFGTIGKIFVEFTKPFWDKDWEGVSFLWRPEELRILREDPENSEWLKNIIGFYTVSFQPNVLCGWLSGDAARKMEQAGDDDFKAGVERVLRMFLKEWNGAEVKNIIRCVIYFDCKKSPNISGKNSNENRNLTKY